MINHTPRIKDVTNKDGHFMMVFRDHNGHEHHHLVTDDDLGKCMRHLFRTTKFYIEEDED